MDAEWLKLLTDTTNRIAKAKGYQTTLSEAQVELVVNAGELINAAIKAYRKEVKC